MRKENIESLRQRGRMFWLTAEVGTIMERIKNNAERPSLTDKSYVEEVEEVLNERLPLYKAAADHVIATDGRTVEEIGDEVQQKM